MWAVYQSECSRNARNAHDSSHAVPHVCAQSLRFDRFSMLAWLDRLAFDDRSRSWW